MRKILKILFIILTIFSSIQYIDKAIYGIFYKIPIHQSYQWFFTKFSFVRYMKDVTLVVLAIFLLIYIVRFVKDYRAIKNIVIPFSILVIYGTIFSVIDHSFSLMQLASGLRPILLLITTYFACTYMYDDFKVYNIFISILLYIITVISFLQYIIIKISYTSTRIGVLRIIATFGGPGVLGHFAFAVSFYLYVVHFYKRTMSTFQFYINQTLCLFLSIVSGTRSTMLLILLTLVMCIYNELKEKGVLNNFNKRNLNIIITSFLAIFTFIAVKISNIIAHRGEMISQQLHIGRIKVLTDYISQNSLLQIIFGRGIGYGTNTAYILNQEFQAKTNSEIMDGTFSTLISQYGIFFLILVLTLIFFFIRYLVRLNKNNILEVLFFISSSLLICVTTNILEEFSFIILFIYAYVLYIPSHKEKYD